MTSSLLQGRRFYCREWAFSKIHHCLEHRPSTKATGALIMGGPGCGKTAICCEIVWPTSGAGRQMALSKRVLAYYFCQAHDIETLSIANFIHCIVEQITKSKLIKGYEDAIKDPTIQAALETSACERNPDDAFSRAVLVPLQNIDSPSRNLFLLADSIDESYMQVINEKTSGSRTIAELLANHHAMFPPWLLLVCSARKQSKSVTRMFTGFRKISLDDLRKSHVVRDVQQYILSRLDQEEELRQHLSRETAEMLNQLHIKSNGCFLYLEKVLDGVAESFIMLREIREIPGTLNGLYLWLCQRLFAKKQFAKIVPILNVILAARRPLTESELYSCVYTRNTQLDYDEFKTRLDVLSKVLIEGKDGTKIVFHHSFAEWLLDVKHCTQKYLCTAAEGHGMLALSFTVHAASLAPSEVQDYALHLSKANLTPPMEAYHLSLWMLQSGANVEESLKGALPSEQSVVKLLQNTGAILPTPDMSETNPPIVVEESSSDPLESEIMLNLQDNSGRTPLASACYEGNVTLTQALIVKGADLEIEDKVGQSALNLAARQGHSEIVGILLEAGSIVDHTDRDGWTPLRSAAWGGHTQVVSLLLEGGAEVDHADSDQRTALRAAAWGGHDEIVLKLLEHGAEVNKIDNEGRSALIAAAYMGHVEIVEHLLDQGADINHEDRDGRTALSVAALCVPASEGHAGVVSLLLERGAAVNHCDKDGMTPLLVAAYEGHHEVCELLLEGDADVDHSDKNNRTPLQAAASMGHANVVSLLLFWGAAVDTIDADGRTVLCIAAQQGNVDVVTQLLDRGLDEMHRDNSGWTPLHLGSYEGHREVVEALLEAGARSTEIDNDGRMALHLAAQEGHITCVVSLLESGSPIEAKAHDGKTALRLAALEGHKDVVHLLIQESADVNYQDADGRSTLYVLALENHLILAKQLLDDGADVECADLEGRTALHVAAWQGHSEMVELLLSNGAKVNAVDNDMRTALQSASWQGHYAIVCLLLERGAIVDHMCNQGATALCIAAQEGHEEVVKALLRFKANPNHSDQYGRSATRVALKGGHENVVKILEENGASPLNGVGNRRSGASTASASSIDLQPPGLTHPIYANVNVQNGHRNKSPHDSPDSTNEQRKSHASNQNSKSSGNLSASNTSSTNQSSSSAPECIDSPGMSFTQQLQQCSANKNRNRPMSRVLSPVSEPTSPTHSANGGSPMSEVTGVANHVSPDVHSPCMAKPSSPRREQYVGNSKSVHIISNPHAEYTQNTDEPVWQRLTDMNSCHGNSNGTKPIDLSYKDPYGGALVMGQTALSMKSPDSRKKRNGIVTNPKYAKSVSINGYFNKLANLPDNMENYPVTNGNSSPGGGSVPHKRAQRPNGLPIKKETPL